MVIQEAWQERKWGRQLAHNPLAKQLALALSASIRWCYLFLISITIPSRLVVGLDRVTFESWLVVRPRSLKLAHPELESLSL